MSPARPWAGRDFISDAHGQRLAGDITYPKLVRAGRVQLSAITPRCTHRIPGRNNCCMITVITQLPEELSRALDAAQ